MTYDQLIAFLAVADRGTFAAASQHLYKSQPAVSKLVSNLEDELELELFDRSGYRPVLTSAGEIFRQRARLVIEETEGLRDLAAELGSGLEPQVHVVIDAVTPMARVASALTRVREAYPQARIELRTESLGSTLDRLQREDADLAIAPIRDIQIEDLEMKSFVDVAVIPVARHDHPLARVEGPIPTRALLKHVQVILRESSPTSASYSLNVLPGAQQWSVSDVSSKLEVIAAGLGWGGLPDWLVAEPLASGLLRELEVPDFAVRDMPLCLARRRRASHGPVAIALWNAFSQVD